MLGLTAVAVLKKRPLQFLQSQELNVIGFISSVTLIVYSSVLVLWITLVFRSIHLPFYVNIIQRLSDRLHGGWGISSTSRFIDVNNHLVYETCS